MVKTKRLKLNILHFGFNLWTSIAQPVTVEEALCVLLGKRTKPHNKYFDYYFIPYHISSAPQSFCLLKCSLLARKFFQILVLAKINTLLACSQMLAKTILYPANVSQFSRAGNMCCRNKFCCSENKKCFFLESKTFLLPGHKFCVRNVCFTV